MIIKRLETVSTEIVPVISKKAGGHKTRLWLGYHDSQWPQAIANFVQRA